jgi:hypothetical protein
MLLHSDAFRYRVAVDVFKHMLIECYYKMVANTKYEVYCLV